jgi:hypothetical protein
MARREGRPHASTPLSRRSAGDWRRRTREAAGTARTAMSKFDHIDGMAGKVWYLTPTVYQVLVVMLT